MRCRREKIYFNVLLWLRVGSQSLHSRAVFFKASAKFCDVAGKLNIDHALRIPHGSHTPTRPTPSRPRPTPLALACHLAQGADAVGGVGVGGEELVMGMGVQRVDDEHMRRGGVALGGVVVDALGQP